LKNTPSHFCLNPLAAQTSKGLQKREKCYQPVILPFLHLAHVISSQSQIAFAGKKTLRLLRNCHWVNAENEK